MTLLNTPMPPNKALKIIRSICDTGICKITISIKYWDHIEKWLVALDWFSWYIGLYHWDYIMIDTWGFDELLEDQNYEITIESIVSDYPTYSVWDKVLILSTGEIGEIEEILDERLQNENNLKTYGIKLQSDKFLYWVHRSQIAKLPNDL